eukprot:6992508-Alexandrium_andersonii.AAC.1
MGYSMIHWVQGIASVALSAAAVRAKTCRRPRPESTCCMAGSGVEWSGVEWSGVEWSEVK